MVTKLSYSILQKNIVLCRKLLQHQCSRQTQYRYYTFGCKMTSIYHEYRPCSSSYLPISHTSAFYLKTCSKYHSHNKDQLVKEMRQQPKIKTVKGQVIKGVQRAILDKKTRLLLTEEQLKTSSRKMLANLKETKYKMKGKVEEIIERENICTIPNLLCLSRIAISPLLGYLILEHNFDLALGLLTLAGITDLLDGWIARTYKSQASNLGTFLDPMADKILIATMFLTLTYANIIPVCLTGLIITRDMVLVCAGFVIRYKSLPPPRTLSRYFDPTHATAKLAPTFISKCNTMVQLFSVASTLAAPVFGYLDHPLLYMLWCVTAGTTVISAASYILSKNSFKFLKKNP